MKRFMVTVVASLALVVGSMSAQVDGRHGGDVSAMPMQRDSMMQMMTDRMMAHDTMMMRMMTDRMMAHDTMMMQMMADRMMAHDTMMMRMMTDRMMAHDTMMMQMMMMRHEGMQKKMMNMSPAEGMPSGTMQQRPIDMVAPKPDDADDDEHADHH